MLKQSESWEREFDERYTYVLTHNRKNTKGITIPVTSIEIKSFISSLLLKERARVRERVEKKKRTIVDSTRMYNFGKDIGYNRAISEILAILDEKKSN